MLGQRADGELLRFAEEGVSPRRRLRHEGRGAGGARRVHRGLLQQPTSSLVAGVRFPSGVRTVRKLLTYCPLFVGNSTVNIGTFSRTILHSSFCRPSLKRKRRKGDS